MLSHSPLAMVLAQVRFPKDVTVLGKYDVLDEAMLAAGFPMAATVVDNIASFDPNGVLQSVNKMERRAYDSETGDYTLSVGKSFMSLYCVDKGQGIPYKGHQEFLELLSLVIEKIAPITGAIPVARLGYRYVDSLEVADALEVVSDACLGFAGALQNDSFDFGVQSSMVETYLSLSKNDGISGTGAPSEGIHLACGTLPPGASFDQSVPPQTVPRWIIDIDSYSQAHLVFSASDVREKASDLAEAARHLFYDHVVTDRFVEKYQ